MKSSDVRREFIDFFKSKSHTFVKASPVIPVNDPTLLFINAGMNQFKPYFLGEETSPNPRVVNSQPCIRVSGKHNDLEDVGIDTYHHTCFEMLGNWSFGDYYKKEAIVWAWELLTEVYRLPKEHLVATVFEEDEEAAQLWRDHTDIKKNAIVKCSKKDNFWEMGSTGPCGPCSEIHLDLSPEIGGDPIQDPKTKGLTERYMELWNLVFIQYDRQSDGTLNHLPETHIDTGAGLERLTAQIQGVSSNYDTDCFQKLIHSVQSQLGVPYGEGVVGTPHRVISDHIRTVSFAIADNVLPSNEGRGYVLRRLIRRALRFASQAGKNEPFLHGLIPIVNESLGGHFAHIGDRVDYISELVKSEEEQFLRTVQSGLKLFHQVIIDLKANKQTTIDGKTAFKLYDTHGFPLDLTEVMAKEQSLMVDTDGFEESLNHQRELSRAARTERLDDGADASIQALSSYINDVHHGVYVDQPGGGEHRIPVNDQQRFGIAQHHTATHLLHAGLRSILGDHVEQAGSLVDVNRLRFDFTHGKPVTKDQLSSINKMVNQWIQENHAISISEEAIDDAKQRGAIAMFGEKYSDQVRVVEIPHISIELCGGNHVKQTQDLQEFQIVSEGTIAAGTRRIEAISGTDRVSSWNADRADSAYAEYEQKYNEALLIHQKLSNKNQAIPAQIEKAGASFEHIHHEKQRVIAIIKGLEKQLQQEQRGQAGDLMNEMIDTATKLKAGNGVGVFKVLENQPIPVLKDLADRLVSKLGDSVVILGSSMDNKAHAVVKVSPSLISEFKAPGLINELTKITGGGGGGRDHMAQAGGVDSRKLDDGIQHMTNQYLI